MNRRLLALTLALLALLLALVVTGAVRDLIVVPLLFLFYVAGLVYQIVPQAVLWAIFLLLAAITIVVSLIRSEPLMRVAPAAPPTPGRVARWASLAGRAAGDEYERWSLARQLAQLFVEVLAHEAQCSPQDVIRRLESGEIDLAPEARAYLRAGLAVHAPAGAPRRSIWNMLFSRPAAPLAPFDRDPTLVIQYLEAVLQQSTGDSR